MGLLFRDLWKRWLWNPDTVPSSACGWNEFISVKNRVQGFYEVISDSQIEDAIKRVDGAESSISILHRYLFGK